MHIQAHVEITHQALRARVVDYLRTHRHTRNGTAMNEWIVNQDWDSYLTELSQDGVWGDEIVLIAVSNMFSVEIGILSSIPGEPIHILTPAATDPRNLPMLLLGHLHELHYYSLEVSSQNASIIGNQMEAETDKGIRDELFVDPRVAALLDEVQGRDDDSLWEFQWRF